MAIILRRSTRQLRRQVLSTRDHTGADLAAAKLHDLDLRGKVFRNANLRGADLTACDLRGVDLLGADLRSAFLTGAQCNGANLRGANLTGAYAVATDFGDAAMDGAILDRVIYDQATTWPTGVRPPRPS
jgi:uncharacterized protein YjbI with pentapeptide repeats